MEEVKPRLVAAPDPRGLFVLAIGLLRRCAATTTELCATDLEAYWLAVLEVDLLGAVLRPDADPAQVRGL